MQIHEITQRKLLEASIPTEFGKALANRFAQSAIGVDAFEKPTAPPSITPKAPIAQPAPAAQPVQPAQPAQSAQPAQPAPAAQPADQGIVVTPGRRIRIVDPKNKGVYFKTARGWVNELGQPLNPASVSYLEKLADQGLGKEENIPAVAQRAKPMPQKPAKIKRKR